MQKRFIAKGIIELKEGIQKNEGYIKAGIDGSKKWKLALRNMAHRDTKVENLCSNSTKTFIQEHIFKDIKKYQSFTRNEFREQKI